MTVTLIGHNVLIVLKNNFKVFKTGFDLVLYSTNFSICTIGHDPQHTYSPTGWTMWSEVLQYFLWSNPFWWPITKCGQDQRCTTQATSYVSPLRSPTPCLRRLRTCPPKLRSSWARENTPEFLHRTGRKYAIYESRLHTIELCKTPSSNI